MKKLLIGTLSLLMIATGVTAAELTEKEKAGIIKAVKRELKDPDSAKFMWVKLKDKLNGDAEYFNDHYCGLVNAKNSYGGYTGFEPFKVMMAREGKGKFTIIHVTVASSSLDAKDIADMCADKGYANFSQAE